MPRRAQAAPYFDTNHGRVGAGLLGNNAAVPVAHGQKPVTCRPDDAELAFDAAQDGHAGMRPGVAVEIIGRHQHGLDAQSGVSASKSREIHVLANGNAEARAIDLAYDIFVTRLESRLEARYQMLFSVIGDQFARPPEQPGAIFKMIDADHGDTREQGYTGLVGGVAQQFAHALDPRWVELCDLFRPNYDLGAAFRQTRVSVTMMPKLATDRNATTASPAGPRNITS